MTRVAWPPERQTWPPEPRALVADYGELVNIKLRYNSYSFEKREYRQRCYIAVEMVSVAQRNDFDYYRIGLESKGCPEVARLFACNMQLTCKSRMTFFGSCILGMLTIDS